MSSALQHWDELHLHDLQWVSELIELSAAQWNINLLPQLFTSEQVNSILTNLIQLDHPDTLIWHFTTAGIFTNSSTYKMLCAKDSLNDVSLNLSQSFWLKFWKLKMPYKFQIFLWKGLHNALTVKARLFRHMSTSDQQCVVCNTGTSEDVDHLLLHCPFAQAVWRKSLPQYFSSIVQHSTLLSWIQSWQIQDSPINIYSNYNSIHIIVCIMHIIWKHRCKVIFSNLNPNPNTVIHQISYYISVHHLDTVVDNSHTLHHSLSVRNALKNTWRPPPMDVLKVNIDASFNPQSLIAGLSITRNYARQYVVGKGAIKRAINVHQAEAWALLEAMDMASTHGWTQVIFETDNLNISSYL
ncbi:uncharacterized protein LOC113272196 [Papaver somniferum]|uniref:uncharacterized protein LOC113272196 n=1 Tax=Papaver somniferum TaxID=3469 RepID=UPI000E6F6A37|nr:uncharacterized protein LOC113272196 [Papaver somniferum]